MLAKIGQIEMECNSENSSDANDVHLEGNFYFHSLSLLLETEIFYRCRITFFYKWLKAAFRSNHPEVFWRKGVLKICSKFTGEPTCRSAISIKLLSNFIEIALRHGCSPVNLLHIFRTPFLKITFEWLLLNWISFANDYFLLSSSR